MTGLQFKYSNLQKAYQKLQEVSNIYDGQDDIVRDSLIQRFEFTYELCHKTLQAFLQDQGIVLERFYPREIFKIAYMNGLIKDEMLWIDLLKDRNLTSHIYNEQIAISIAQRISTSYVVAIGDLVQNIGKSMD